MAWTNVLSVYVSAGTSVQAISGRCRVRAFSIAQFATAVPSQFIFKDGATSTSRLTVDVNGAGTTFHKIPDAGIIFVSGVSITCPTSCTMTVYYDGVT